MTNRTFYSIIFICLILSGLSIYYIYMNTVLAKNIYTKVEVNGIEYSLNEDNVESRLNEIILKGLPQTFKFKIEDETFTIPTSELNVTADTNALMNYGKGSNPTKVFSEALGMITGDHIDIDFNIDPNPVLKRLPYTYQEEGYIQLVNDKIYNCENRIINTNINIDNLKDMIQGSLKRNELMIIRYEDIIGDKNLINLLYKCTKFIKKVNALEKELGLDINLFSVLLPEIEDDSINIIIGDRDKLFNILKDHSYINYRVPNNGDYFEKDNKLYFTKIFEYGNKLNIDSSILNIQRYLDSTLNNEDILVFEPITPDVLKLDKEIVDMTQKMGAGYTRLDVIRDGAFNYRVPNSQAPLWALNNLILEPGREFSFHNDSGIATNSVRSGIGVCNSTTTLFRAALDAGLDITDRSPHTSYVRSYEYGPYPLNIVEATYNPYPFVDLKFKNDLKHPIVLKIIIDRRDDGYQYHTVEIYTSPEEPKREVELTDWSKYNIIDDTHFRGSFKRIVRVNGVIIKEEKYNSNYTYY